MFKAQTYGDSGSDVWFIARRQALPVWRVVWPAPDTSLLRCMSPIVAGGICSPMRMQVRADSRDVLTLIDIAFKWRRRGQFVMAVVRGSIGRG